MSDCMGGGKGNPPEILRTLQGYPPVAAALAAPAAAPRTDCSTAVSQLPARCRGSGHHPPVLPTSPLWPRWHHAAAAAPALPRHHSSAPSELAPGPHLPLSTHLSAQAPAQQQPSRPPLPRPPHCHGPPPAAGRHPGLNPIVWCP